MARVYEEYSWRDEYEGLPLTEGGFSIIPGRIEGRPAVCIKQRNGRGSSPYLFDLPGGARHAADRDLGAAAVREAFEEVGVRCVVVADVGEPLYLPVRKDGEIVRVDRAQAFLVSTRDEPVPGDEALAVAYVHAESFAGFNVVGRRADPSSPVFGRTPVMIFDGLSVLQEPFFRGELPDEMRSLVIGEGNGFLPVDGGNYLGRLSWLGWKRQIALYYRLNPDQPDGRFHGSLDHLAD